MSYLPHPHLLRLFSLKTILKTCLMMHQHYTRLCLSELRLRLMSSLLPISLEKLEKHWSNSSLLIICPNEYLLVFQARNKVQCSFISHLKKEILINMLKQRLTLMWCCKMQSSIITWDCLTFCHLHSPMLDDGRKYCKLFKKKEFCYFIFTRIFLNYF